MYRFNKKNIIIIAALTLLLLPYFSSHVSAQCGTSWGLVNYTKGNVFRAVSSDGVNRFVAIGDYGVCWTSDDGEVWTKRASNRTNTFDIGYGGSKFVVVGALGFIATSSDGERWTERSTPVTNGLWGITYGDGLWVATGNLGVIMTSPDGVAWTKRNSGTTKNLLDVTYGNGLYIAVGVGSIVLKSADGINWSHAWTAEDNLNAVKYGGGVFVASGRGEKIYRSTDGSSWTRVHSGTASYYLHDVEYTGSNFVAVGSYGNVYNSGNGSTWTKRNSRAPTSLMGVTACNGKVAAVGLVGQVSLSYCSAPSPARLALAAPNGGEEVQGGDSFDIRWGSFGTMGNVKLEYSTDNGSSWNSIVNSTSNSFIYSWTVPVIAETSSTCLVRISEAAGSISDTGNGTFTMNAGGSSGGTLTVTSPNGGETLTPGSKHSIRWSSSGVNDTIRIRYSTDGGKNYEMIADNLANTGSWTWTVPNVTSSQCMVRINAINTDGLPYDESDGVFGIGTTATPASLTVTAPNGGENLTIGSNYSIRWTSESVTNQIRIRYSTDGGDNWIKIADNLANSGSWTWTVPNVVSSQCLVRINAINTDGVPYDVSDAVFNIAGEVTGTITVNSPNGGETLLKGSTQGITWTTTGEVGNLKLEYSINGGTSWNTIAASTGNDGYYAWQLPTTESDSCLVRISDVNNPAMSDISNRTFAISGVPEIVLNKSKFSFGYVAGGVAPQAQQLMISSSGSQLNWTAAAEASWVSLTQSSGIGNALLDVSVDPSVLPVGTHTTTLTVRDPNAIDPDVDVTVSINIIQSYQDQPPFGDMALPDEGKTGVSGSIAVSGWALDDVELASVKIYREVNGGLSYIGDASFVEGAREDVEAAYPDYPNNTRAGWGYMMLTNFLPEGELKLVAVARDVTGYETVLGTRTIYLDNTNAVEPFGAIDTPAQGGIASGTTFRNEGWALTPNPDKIPEDGSTVNVFINGDYVGKAYYGLYRKDIADFFPGLANTDGAKAYFDFDTTELSNGVHTIEWSVTDTGGHNGGIGSRFFTVANVSTRPAAGTAAVQAGPEGVQAVRRAARPHISMIPRDSSMPVGLKKGYDLHSPATEIVPDEAGDIQISMKEVSRIQLLLANREDAANLGRRYTGYLKVGDQLRSLPIGSTMDRKNGVFSWQPGPGFVGTYRFVFVIEEGGQYVKKNVVVTVGHRLEKLEPREGNDKFGDLNDKNTDKLISK